MKKRSIKLVFQRGSYVRLSGLCYGTYDGEIGRVVGDTAPIKVHPAYAVDMAAWCSPRLRLT